MAQGKKGAIPRSQIDDFGHNGYQARNHLNYKGELQSLMNGGFHPWPPKFNPAEGLCRRDNFITRRPLGKDESYSYPTALFQNVYEKKHPLDSRGLEKFVDDPDLVNDTPPFSRSRGCPSIFHLDQASGSSAREALLEVDETYGGNRNKHKRVILGNVLLEVARRIIPTGADSIEDHLLQICTPSIEDIQAWRDQSQTLMNDAKALKAKLPPKPPTAYAIFRDRSILSDDFEDKKLLRQHWKKYLSEQPDHPEVIRIFEIVEEEKIKYKEALDDYEAGIGGCLSSLSTIGDE